MTKLAEGMMTKLSLCAALAIVGWGRPSLTRSSGRVPCQLVAPRSR